MLDFARLGDCPQYGNPCENQKEQREGCRDFDGFSHGCELER